MKMKTEVNEIMEAEIKKAQYDYFFRRLRDALAVYKDKFDLDEFLRSEVFACNDIPEKEELEKFVRDKYAKLIKSRVPRVPGSKPKQTEAERQNVMKEIRDNTIFNITVDEKAAEILGKMKEQINIKGYYFDFYDFIRDSVDKLDRSIQKSVTVKLICETAKRKRDAGGLTPCAYKFDYKHPVKCADCGKETFEYYVSDNFRKLCSCCMYNDYVVCDVCGKLHKHGNTFSYNNEQCCVCPDCAKRLRLK